MADFLERNAQRLEDPRSDPLTFAHQAEQQMTRAHLVTPELPGLIDRQLDDLLRPGAQRDVAGLGLLLAASDDELQSRAHLAQVDPERVERSRGLTAALTHQTRKKVLCADVV